MLLNCDIHSRIIGITSAKNKNGEELLDRVQITIEITERRTNMSEISFITGTYMQEAACLPRWFEHQYLLGKSALYCVHIIMLHVGGSTQFHSSVEGHSDPYSTGSQ